MLVERDDHGLFIKSPNHSLIGLVVRGIQIKPDTD